MIDFIVIIASIEPLWDFTSLNPFVWKGLEFYPKYKKGKLIGFESDYKGLRVMLYYERIEVSNSLHKFYKGNNYSRFSYSELEKTIEIICKKFDIDARFWEIKKMEFGFVIVTPKPAVEYLNFFFQYKGNDFEKMKDKKTEYGRKCYMYAYALKVYAKSLQTKIMDNVVIPDDNLRIEFYYNEKRKLPKSIKTLNDLLDREKFKELFNELYQAFTIVVYKDEADLSNSTNEERLLFYASLNPDFLKFEEKVNKGAVKTIKSKIKQLRERFLRKKFKLWFLKSLKTKYIDLYCS